MTALFDQYQRRHDYLRLSITDRCNLRCVYCMPKEGLPFFPNDRVLSQAEIVQLVKNFAALGVTKVRITGGEPLLRTDVVEIIQQIHQIPTIKDIAVTTNGLYLAKKAKALKEAGLNRVNISLDTFKPDVYRQITRGGNIKQVLAGIAAAAEQGFDQIKLNVVLIKGQNDDEVLDFIRYTKTHPVNVRFIEFMPIGNSQADWQQEYVPLTDIFNQCQAAGLEYQPIEFPGNGPADNYQVAGFAGSFGLIHPISSRFCENCNRLRITADGYIKACLYWNEEVNIRPAIFEPAKFKALVQRALNNKPLNHEMALARPERIIDQAPTWRHMSQIGG